MSDDNQPQFEVIGHVEGDQIVWHDGSPPSPIPSDPTTKPADAVCRSADEEE